MLFNLYPIKKLSTINNARAIFLMELRENTYIDISARLYNIIAESTKTTSRSKLVVPNLILRNLHENGVETPQHIGPMPLTSLINSQTILRSRIQIPEDKHAEEAEEAPPVDTETKVEGQQPLPTYGRGRRRRGASSSSSIPPKAFQIILERIDGLWGCSRWAFLQTCSYPGLNQHVGSQVWQLYSLALALWPSWSNRGSSMVALEGELILRGSK